MSGPFPAIAAVLLLLAGARPLSGQALPARPILFADPVANASPKAGAVVLGQTTLKAALRIFAVELEQDSVQVSLGHGANPAVLRGTELFLGGLSIRPYHRLELGPGRYTLYFDKHERLVAAMGAPQDAPPVRRRDLAARYPSLRVQRRGHNAEGAIIHEGVEAPLGNCVSLTGSVWLDRGDLVEGLGYVYTCPTRPQRPTRTR